MKDTWDCQLSILQTGNFLHSIDAPDKQLLPQTSLPAPSWFNQSKMFTGRSMYHLRVCIFFPCIFETLNPLLFPFRKSHSNPDLKTSNKSESFIVLQRPFIVTSSIKKVLMVRPYPSFQSVSLLSTFFSIFNLGKREAQFSRCSSTYHIVVIRDPRACSLSTDTQKNRTVRSFEIVNKLIIPLLELLLVLKQ